MSQVVNATSDEVRNHPTTEEGENWIAYNSLDQVRFTVLIAGASGLGSLVSHPFYVLTTRQQAGTLITGDKPAASFSAGFRNSINRIGWSGLFRGWVPMAAISIPANVMYLTVLERSREQCGQFFSKHCPSSSPVLKDGTQAVYSGVIATFLYQMMFNPAEVLVSRMIVQNPGSRSSLPSTASLILRQDKHGKGFFRGFSGSFGTGIMTSTIWWWSYSTSRRLTTSVLGRGDDKAFLVDGIAGLCAGVSETVLVHPFDSVRARIMTGASPETRYFHALRHVCRTEGFSVLWRGLYPSMCHTMWSSTVFALSYELIKRNSPAAAFAAFEEGLE